MTPTDIMPGLLPAAPAGAAQVRGVAPKDGRRESDDGFSKAMSKVSAGKDKPATAPDRPARQPEAGGPAWRRLEAARLQAEGQADAALLTLDDAAAALLAAKPESTDAERTLPDADDDAAEGEGAEPARAPGEVPLGGGTEALSLLLGHMHRGASQGFAEPKPGIQRVDVNAGASGPAEAPAPVAPVKIVSVKVETHFARNSMDALAAEIGQRLSGLSGLGGLGAGQQAKGTDGGTMPAAAGTTQEAPVLDDLAAQPHGALHGARNKGHETGQRGNDASSPGAALAGEDADAARSPEPAVSTVADPGNPATAAGTPAQQLGNRLVRVVHELQSAEAASRPADAGSTGPAQSGAIRVLSIDLHPAELGSVTVRMSLAGDALEVQIEAERPDTARRLQTDVGALSDMLRSAGVQVDGLTVRAAPPDAISGGGSQSFQDQQTQSGGAQPDARASGGNRREQEAQTPAGRREDQGAGGESRVQPVAGHGLYV